MAMSGRDRVFMAGHLTCIIQNFQQPRSWQGCCLQGPLLRAWGDLHKTVMLAVLRHSAFMVMSDFIAQSVRTF